MGVEWSFWTVFMFMGTFIGSANNSCYGRNERIKDSYFGIKMTKELHGIWRLKEGLGVVY